MRITLVIKCGINIGSNSTFPLRGGRYREAAFSYGDLAMISPTIISKRTLKLFNNISCQRGEHQCFLLTFKFVVGTYSWWNYSQIPVSRSANCILSEVPFSFLSGSLCKWEAADSAFLPDVKGCSESERCQFANLHKFTFRTEILWDVEFPL